MHPNMLTYVCGETSTQSVREKLPGQRRWAHTSELSCVEWGHFEVLKKPSSFHLHHYQLPCGVSAMATNTRHTLTQTRRHTPSPYFSLVVLTHIVLPHFTIKKKEEKTATQRRAPTLRDCGVDINLFGSDNKCNNKKNVSVHSSQPLGKEWHDENTFIFLNFLCLSPTFLQCFSLRRCYRTTVLHHVAMSKSTDCWP